MGAWGTQEGCFSGEPDIDGENKGGGDLWPSPLLGPFHTHTPRPDSQAHKEFWLLNGQE